MYMGVLFQWTAACSGKKCAAWGRIPLCVCVCCGKSRTFFVQLKSSEERLVMCKPTSLFTFQVFLFGGLHEAKFFLCFFLLFYCYCCSYFFFAHLWDRKKFAKSVRIEIPFWFSCFTLNFHLSAAAAQVSLKYRLLFFYISPFLWYFTFYKCKQQNLNFVLLRSGNLIENNSKR